MTDATDYLQAVRQLLDGTQPRRDVKLQSEKKQFWESLTDDEKAFWNEMKDTFGPLKFEGRTWDV